MGAVPSVHGVVMIRRVTVQCYSPEVGVFSVFIQTGDARVEAFVSEKELDAIVAQARDAKVSMLRWRRENACDDEEETYPDDWASS